MPAEWIRKHCLGFPDTSEGVQWGDALVFKVGGKMFAVVHLEPGRYTMSFKCSAEDFAELVERQGVDPAPYLARAHWVALETERALPAAELKAKLSQAYNLVAAKLPKKKLPTKKTISARAR